MPNSTNLLLRRQTPSSSGIYQYPCSRYRRISSCNSIITEVDLDPVAATVDPGVRDRVVRDRHLYVVAEARIDVDPDVVGLVDRVAHDVRAIARRVPVVPEVDVDPVENTAGDENPSAIENEHAYVFRKTSNTWVVRFKTKRATGLKDLKGMSHIAVLLSHPNPPRPIDSSQLLFRDRDPSRRAAVEGTMEVSENERGQDALDDQALREYRNRLVDIEGRLAEAKKNDDVYSGQF